MAGLLCEEEGPGADNVKYCGYCKHHYNKMVSRTTTSVVKLQSHPARRIEGLTPQCKKKINWRTNKTLCDERLGVSKNTDLRLHCTAFLALVPAKHDIKNRYSLTLTDPFDLSDHHSLFLP